MDSPVQAYGKYSNNISVIIPEGETEETTTHNTRGKDKISFDKVYKKSIDLLSNEALLNQFKAKAFDLAKRYDIDAVVAQYIDIYHKALA